MFNIYIQNVMLKTWNVHELFIKIGLLYIHTCIYLYRYYYLLHFIMITFQSIDIFSATEHLLQ